MNTIFTYYLVRNVDLIVLAPVEIMLKKKRGILFLVVLCFYSAKGSETSESYELEDDNDSESTNRSDLPSADDNRRSSIQKRICKIFKSKAWSIKNRCKDIEDLEGSLRQNNKMFDESIESACQRLAWDQDASTWKKKLCLRQGFDGKAKGKVCRVFGGEPTTDDGNVQDLCNRINIQNSRIANQRRSLKWNAKALCNKKNYRKNTKEGKLCRRLKWT